MNRDFKILKINHIAIAVNSNKLDLNLFKLLGMNIGDEEFIKNEKTNLFISFNGCLIYFL